MLLQVGGAAAYLLGSVPVHWAITPVSSVILRLRLLRGRRPAGLPEIMAWGGRRVRVTDSPLAATIEDENGTAIQSFGVDDQGTVTFKSSAGPVFGLGEGGPQFDRRGQTYNMRNGQFAPFLSTIGARLPVPWLISTDGWAIFFQQPFGVIDLRGPEYVFGQPPTAVEDPVPLDIFFVVSREPREILKAYAQIAGFPHMPPLWAFGYQQSHRTLSSREEILDEAKRFRHDKLPCDTLIYLGTGFCPSGWNTGHGSFTFNEKVFPDPKQMIQELHDEHFHIVLHVTRPPEHLHGGVSDTGTAAEDLSDAAFYWGEHLKVFRLGVDGWWPDEGDPLAPEARLARNRMYWEGPVRERPMERPFALHRNGYAGLQRYGWLWSGDVDCRWKTLAEQIPVGLNAGLTGLPYWGTDTGGFVPTKELTGELYVRWFQFSAFCPLFRSHGRTWKLRLPWGWDTGDFGPVEVDMNRMPDPKELHNAQVEPICRKYLDLRYQLLPYTYSAVREGHETGLPLMRALWLHYSRDAKAAALSDEYLWGRDLLIAPVTQPGATSRQVYLPPGVWYDFWSGERVEGPRVVERAVDLATMPIYVRSGTVLALGPVRQYVTQRSDKPMTLRVHPGTGGQTQIYADDGESFAYERGEFMRLNLDWDDNRRQLTVALAPGSKRVWEGFREMRIEVVGGGEAKRIQFEGRAMTLDL
ncbi:MAG TPA: TIM-barrel domain-containing protein [Bryobacteraceae bacterium]|nr:TIM-barrel domain-containing protein [Bryobacteraceae bacterium]